ncbi:MAG: hypothetical protein ABI995_03615 [Acidobacteriota bacterium]
MPHLTGETLEIAIEISPDDPDNDEFRRYGWRFEDPTIVRTPGHFREYVSSSAGEFSCAKGGYAGTNGGWFSDRSSCYLAAGRPVVLQDTGFANLLPTGKGLFSAKTPEEACGAIHAIRSDYESHSIAARQIAREYFDTDVVVRRLLAEADISAVAG